VLTLDLGPAIAYTVRRAARHLDGLAVGGVLTVDVGARRVVVERTADGWTVDGATPVTTTGGAMVELRRAAAAWLVETEAA